MSSRRLSSTIALSAILIATISFAFVGCCRIVLLDTKAIETSNEDKIVVSHKDGSWFVFDGGQYDIGSDSSGTLEIRGKGKQFHKGDSQFRSFDGSISIEAIERISTSENTPFFYVTIALATLATAFIIVVVISLNGRGLGG